MVVGTRARPSDTLSSTTEALTHRLTCVTNHDRGLSGHRSLRSRLHSAVLLLSLNVFDASIVDTLGGLAGADSCQATRCFFIDNLLDSIIFVQNGLLFRKVSLFNRPNPLVISTVHANQLHFTTVAVLCLGTTWLIGSFIECLKAHVAVEHSLHDD